ncbi:UDP-N-acetylmuramate dehydrogenase [Pseudoflavonifractor sp. MSJ-37]|uniref:UDP-N-acetylmuramate dehydrogenase n=1 Tax=Pseudoflavonifractor sp. MSJ-37 TaxID=2841531 RepID=UPI001C0F6E7B|nr:UDP-N-acetylmuramate dehydrogenase [Pseudoflavonifractor sp. MSJ-37]MBU5435055.1 UDP-N-acetylmuramate dehydrogenase [Pseudoflavonifractor sp. MSJ-37]
MDRYAALTRELARVCPGLELREQEPLARHTSFRIGGPARLMALPRSAEEAAQAVRAARALDIRPVFLGNGSNILAADEGYEGFLIKTFDGLSTLEERDGIITAGSGTLLSRLANFALERGLTGSEFAHGIPGTVGGAVTMNAGAYGGEIAQILREVVLLDREGELRTLPAAECELSYRHSAFLDGERMLLSARFALATGDPAQIRARMEDLAARRKAKQPLEHPSAGSTFKRPEGHFAAALIEQCGLKGLTVGGAQVSEKHSGFLINRGGATCADMLALIGQVRARVRQETGVELELEVRTLGI